MNIRMRSTRTGSLLLAIAAVGGGCATMMDSALDRAAQRTGEGVGDAVGKKTGEIAGAYVVSRFPAAWTPDLTNIYVGYLFSLAFHSGGYSVGGKAYASGDWTKWNMVDSSGKGKASTLERAFLGKQADGKEWWRVKLTDGESGDQMILEGLFSADASELVRLRGKMPRDVDAKEMPVQKGTFGYVKPTELTAESIQGATVGPEKITVPAGSYNTKHVRYGGMGGGTLDWWLIDRVPGGMEKYSTSDTNAAAAPSGGAPNAHSWALELAGVGAGAKSELGVNVAG